MDCWSQGLYLICLVLGISYVTYVEICAHRMLSCHDVAVADLSLMDTLTVIYFDFVPKSERSTLHGLLLGIYTQCISDQIWLPEVKKSAQTLQHLQKKNFTEDSKRRKELFVGKSFYYRTGIHLTMNFYVVTIPLLKKYVCFFQIKDPLIHKFHIKHLSLFVEFLSYFVKQGNLESITPKNSWHLTLKSPLCPWPEVRSSSANVAVLSINSPLFCSFNSCFVLAKWSVYELCCLHFLHSSSLRLQITVLCSLHEGMWTLQNPNAKILRLPAEKKKKKKNPDQKLWTMEMALTLFQILWNSI